MAQVINLTLPDMSHIRAEIKESPPEDNRQEGTAKTEEEVELRTAEEVEVSFQKAFSGMIAPFTGFIKDAVRNTDAERMQVEFGVKIDPQFVTVLTEGNDNAHFKIALSWKK
jgi:hypothetical protein